MPRCSPPASVSSAASRKSSPASSAKRWRSARSLSSDHVPGLADFLRAARCHDLCRPRLAAPAQRRSHRAVGAAWRGDPLHVTDPDARAIAQELADGRFYYAEVAAVADAGVQPVYSLRVDTDDHSFVTNGFVSHNTECRLSPLAMAMLQDIDEDTVDFSPNYDGKTQEPDVLPSPRAEPADQRQRRHRRRHGHQHPAAQPAGGRRRRRLGTRAPRGRPRRSCSPR